MELEDIHDGLDRRFHNPTAAQFNEDVIADFMFRHDCGILYHGTEGNGNGINSAYDIGR